MLAIAPSGLAATSYGTSLQQGRPGTLCHAFTLPALRASALGMPIAQPTSNPNKTITDEVSTRTRRRAWHSVRCSVASPAACAVQQGPGGGHESDEPLQPLQGNAAPISPEQVSLYRTAKAMQLSGRRGDALAVLQQGLGRFPTDRHMLALTASLLTKSNQLSAARSVLETAMGHHPHHLPFITATAMLEVRLGQHAPAVQRLMEAHAQFPENAVVLQALGEAEAAAGNHPRARRHLRDAWRLSPHMPHVYATWAHMELACGDVEGARRLFSAGVSAVPGHAPLLQAWATLEHDLGHGAAAKQLCEQALQADPQHVPSYMLLGQLSWSEGDTASAREHWRRGNASQDGRCAPLLCFWAQREARVHNVRSARGLLEAALRAAPGDPRAATLLAGLDDRAGGREAASDAYRQLLGAPRGQVEPGADGLLLGADGDEPGPRAHPLQQVQAAAAGAVVEAVVATPAMAYEQFQRDQERQREQWQRAVAGGDAHGQDSQQAPGQQQQRQWQRVDNHLPANGSPPAPQASSINGSTPASPTSWQADPQHSNGMSPPSPSAAASPPLHDGSPDPANGATYHQATPTTALQPPAMAPPTQPTMPPAPPPLPSIPPDTPVPVLLSMCQHLLRQGQQQQAETLLAHAEIMDPHNGHMCHMRGLLAQKEGLVREAETWFRRGARSAPNAGGLLCWEALAELFAFLGRADEARGAWRKGKAHARRRAGWGPAADGIAHQRPEGVAADGAAQQQPSSLQSGVATNAAGHQWPAHPLLPQPGTAAIAFPPAIPTAQASTQPPREAQASTQSPREAGRAPATTGPHRGPVSGATVPVDGTDGLPPDVAASGPDVEPPEYVGLTSRYLRQWALFEKKNGRADEACGLFEAAAAKDPQDFKTWLAWAVLERRRGQLRSAEQLFRRGIMVAPQNPHLWHAYVTMLWRQKGDVNSARAALRKATSLCPRSVALWLEWALLEWKGAGDPLAARQLLEKGAAVPLAQPYGPLFEAWAQLDREMIGRRRKGERVVYEDESETREDEGVASEREEEDGDREQAGVEQAGQPVLV